MTSLIVVTESAVGYETFSSCEEILLRMSAMPTGDWGKNVASGMSAWPAVEAANAYATQLIWALLCNSLLAVCRLPHLVMSGLATFLSDREERCGRTEGGGVKGGGGEPVGEGGGVPEVGASWAVHTSKAWSRGTDL
ncbi:hypothetical protein BaRGS_00015967 [Batillaria attramentaria]|uniref:Uncharacterized protein n=1 Tax=Batillaria attramentaria TaxID=370345 RepID=A0ABD0L081_9CAEN